MKYSILSVFFAAVFFTACQEVIDIELKNTDPVLVIEANITDQPGPYTVTLSKSVNFSDDNQFPAVSGATVLLEDDAGNSELLAELSPGNYVTSSFAGVPGRTYTLTVVCEGKTYTASSTMPAAIELDSLIVEPGTGFGGTIYYIIPLWLDPAGQGNYYRCIEYQNGDRIGSFLYDDAFSDGLVNGQPLLNFETQLYVSDTIRVDFQCIDQPVYRYFFSMAQTSNNETAAPANPESNFSNGALGYFSAHTVRARNVIIQ